MNGIDYRQMAKLEQQLVQITRERDSLRHQNSKLNDEISVLSRKISQQKLILRQSALPHSESIRSPLSEEGTANRLNHILQSKIEQVVLLENSNAQLSLQLTNVQSQLEETLNLLDQRQIQFNLTKQQCQALKNTTESYRRQMDNLNQQLSKSYEERLKLINENAVANKNAQNQREQHQDKLVGLIEQLGPIKDFLSKPEKSNKETPRDRQDQKILALQQDQLESRNEQIQRLRIVCGGNPLPSEQSNLKNTIKHLKGELGRYNNMMRQFVEKSINAEHTIKQFQEATKRYQKESQMVGQLRIQNGQLKDKVEQLQLELEDVSSRLEEERRLARENKVTLINILVENQNYHELMYQSYPNNYSYFIDKHRKEYFERLRERQKSEKWVNLEELVTVNENMRKRLKLI